MTLLNLEGAAQLAANYFLKDSPHPHFEGVDYHLIAKKIINGSTSNLSQLMLDRMLMVYAGLEWGLYTADQFEEHLRSKILEWLATP